MTSGIWENILRSLILKLIMANTNEKDFFRELAKLEKIQISHPLSIKEIEQIYFDVSMQKSISPLIDFVRRIEHAHGIGVHND